MTVLIDPMRPHSQKSIGNRVLRALTNFKKIAVLLISAGQAYHVTRLDWIALSQDAFDRDVQAIAHRTGRGDNRGWLVGG
jgi:hypothetical protein